MFNKNKTGGQIMKQITLIILSITLILVWGCNKDQSPTADERTLNELAIQNAISDIESSEEGDYFYSNLNDESEDNFFDPTISSFTTLGKQIIPLRFGRIARPIVKDIRIIFDTDTSATVMFRKEMRGLFRILAADTSTQDTIQIYRVNKKLGHEFQRIAHFAKRGSDNEARRGWRLVDFSMALGESYGFEDSTRVKTDLEIVKFIVQSESIDTTIADPLGYFQTKENVFSFTPGTEVTLTVYVNNSSLNPYIFPEGTQATELVRLHYARHRIRRFHGIKRFDWIGQDIDGNNIYQGTWTVGNRFGIHHATIDVIDNGTILDDDEAAYPYNSVTWSTPYLVNRP